MSEPVNLVAPAYEAWPILAPGQDPTALLAAEELQTRLQQITARSVPIIHDPTATESPLIELAYEEGGGDGFVRQVRVDGVRLVGRSARGLLCGVYDLLEELGCRWYAPGTLGERIPRSREATLPLGIVDSEPLLPHRGLILTGAGHVENAVEWIEWACRNRLSYIHFRRPSSPKPRNQFDRAWAKRGKRIAAELSKRGMGLEFGGAMFSEMLPRWRFLLRRDAFRHGGMRRTPDYNLCASSPAGMEYLRRRAEAWFRKHPGVDVYHVWPDDAPPGRWCRCPLCRDLEPSDQALQVINQLAEVLSGIHPHAALSYLAQGDTAPAPASVQPRSNVMLHFAPDERCYAHALDDDMCELNAGLRQSRWLALVDWFRASSERAPSCGERYVDGTYWRTLGPPLSSMISADLRAYRDGGCQRMAAIVSNRRPWLRIPDTAWAFARLAWEPGRDLDELGADYALGYFGGPADLLATYLRELETAFQLLLDLAPEERAPSITGIATRPPYHAQVLEHVAASPPVRRAKLSALTRALNHIDSAAHLLDEASRPGAGWKPRGRVTRLELLDREKRSLNLVSLIFDYLYERQLAYCLSADQAPRREIRDAVQKAERTLALIAAWGKREIRGRADHAEFASIWQRWQAEVWALKRDVLAKSRFARSIWQSRIARRLKRLR